MIPADFPPHWRAAIETGDASGFKTQDDFVAFFRATSIVNGCFGELSDAETDNVVGLRDGFPEVNEAARQAATKEREAAPRFIGVTNLARAPTLAELQPEIDAIETGLGKMSRSASESWAKVIAKHNQGVP
ncbi:hypothetical protein [Mesorhizobium sp. LjNodule214]|uniref:hypothetical protein n=1 Tax=Mesorhizobium sp. LjNodule214 TaxID=3342252 RepID=UPI003ECCFE1B